MNLGGQTLRSALLEVGWEPPAKTESNDAELGAWCIARSDQIDDEAARSRASGLLWAAVAAAKSDQAERCASLLREAEALGAKP